MRCKKGQVSIVVIVALVILLLLGFGFYYFSVNSDREIDKNEYDNTELGDKYKLVTDYVESCMSKVALDASILLGQGGGRIYFEDEDELMPYSTSLSKDYVPLYPGGEQYVSYFTHLNGRRPCFYCDERYSCQCEMESPMVDGLDRAKEDMIKYLEVNSYECINEVFYLSDKGYDISNLSGLKYDVLFHDDSIDVFLDYKLGIQLDNQYKEIDKYHTTINVPFKKAYDAAMNISFYFLRTQRAENTLKNLIRYYSGLDSGKLPPFYDITNGFEVVYWSRTKVKSLLNNLILSYFGLMQVEGSLNFEEFEESVYRYFNLDPFGNETLNFEIAFNYYGTESYIEIFPDNGELLKPKIIKKGGLGALMPQGQINVYDFFYDVSFPLIGTIVYYNQTDVNEFVFNFGYQVNLIKNSNIVELMTDLGPTGDAINATLDYDYSVIDTESDDDFCSDISRSDIKDKCYNEMDEAQDNVDSTVDGWLSDSSSDDRSLFCDERQFLSDNFTLVIKDQVSDETLKDVNIDFACGDYNSCYIGVTKPDDENDKNIFFGNAPICKNGLLVLQKDGYYVSKIPFSTDNLESRYKVVKMVKEFNVNISLDVFQIVKLEDSLGLSEILNVSDFTAILTFTKNKVREYDSDYVKVILFDDLNEVKNIDLISGSYSMSGVLVDNGEIIIPKKCKKVKDNWIKDDVYIPDNDIVLKAMPYGGVEFSANSTYLNVVTDDLISDKELKIKFFRFREPGCFDTLDQLEKPDYYTKYFGNRIYPEWI